MKDCIAKLFSLESLVVIVSGGSRGIGAALADGMSAAGAKVIAHARSDRPRSGFVNDVIYHKCDVTNSRDFALLCSSVYEEYGRLNVLVNCAGISLPVDTDPSMPTNFMRTVEVNLNAQYLCMAIARERMIASGGGAIINVCSLGSVLGMPGNPGYVASKGGLRMLSKAVAVDWGKDGIRINNIIPGYIHTNMTDKSYNDPELSVKRLERVIIRRWGQPEDLIGAAIFLASEASGYITGQDIVVDGGWTVKGLS